ncbi:FecR domain-containing protein [Erwinia sp. S43]|uniref:FecR domain-containing protein n=1 Tax=Erwinia sp. S43 TaxID=2769339 RepID=UPI00190E147C|nr:FecR domain-containing protein [Erwinia sp. S43]MBK0035489.1 FecR domain-containing protein [Erwinia sp. S43]
MTDSFSHKPDYQALQQAAEWYAQLLEAGPQTEIHLRWSVWLNASEENRHAWHYVQAVSQRFQPLNGEIASAAADTLLSPSRIMGRRRALKLTAFFASGTLLSWLTYRHTPLLAFTADYHSAVGEIKQLTLQDGTRLWLNTSSAVDVRYDEQRRQIVLLSGDLLIETARDWRPLFVSSAQGQMQALGTRFSVEQHDSSTHLAVYNGSVEVSATNGFILRRVNAGQQLDFDRFGKGVLSPSANVDASWSEGVLQANNTPLGEIIKQLARYRYGYLACDPDIADLQVMGAFPLTDTDKSLAMLAQIFPVRIHRRFSWWVTVEKL